MSRGPNIFLLLRGRKPSLTAHSSFSLVSQPPHQEKPFYSEKRWKPRRKLIAPPLTRTMMPESQFFISTFQLSCWAPFFIVWLKRCFLQAPYLCPAKYCLLSTSLHFIHSLLHCLFNHNILTSPYQISNHLIFLSLSQSITLHCCRSKSSETLFHWPI